MLNHKARRRENGPGIERFQDSPLRPENPIVELVVNIVPNPTKRELDSLCGYNTATVDGETVSNCTDVNGASTRLGNVVDYGKCGAHDCNTLPASS